MNKLRILVGVSASGKSTYAKKLVRESTERWVRVNRDDLRKMLFGYTPATLHEYYGAPGLRHKERVVSDIQSAAIAASLDNIVIDNTHLKLSYITDLIYTWEKSNKIEIKTFPIDQQLALVRDSRREASVGRAVLEKQFKQYETLINSTEFKYLKMTHPCIEK